MPVFKTSQGRDVRHCHIPDPPCKKKELTPADIADIEEILKVEYPDVFKAGEATRTYNCHGYALAASHGWFQETQAVLILLNDDYVRVSFDDPRENDIIVYYNGSEPAHTGEVMRVRNGRIAKVRSKWGGWPLLVHGLYDVPEDYGEPLRLMRRRPAPQPFDALTGGIAMMDADSKAEIIRRAVDSFSDRKVYLKVLLASTPEVARRIIESLPGVRELIALGPEAGQAALAILQREGGETDDELASIALYVLQRSPTPEAVTPLARAFSEGQFTGINQQLAADALLTSANIEAVTEDSITVATREAENLK